LSGRGEAELYLKEAPKGDISDWDSFKVGKRNDAREGEKKRTHLIKGRGKVPKNEVKQENNLLKHEQRGGLDCSGSDLKKKRSPMRACKRGGKTRKDREGGELKGNCDAE